MVFANKINDDVETYRSRTEKLYADVRSWILERHRAANFTHAEISLSEESTGEYKVESLEISLANLPAVQFIPRGIFLIGAHGRVDVRSRLGREILVWVEAGGPRLKKSENLGMGPEAAISRPVFQDVAEGWAWSDSSRSQILALTPTVLWDKILSPLTA